MVLDLKYFDEIDETYINSSEQNDCGHQNCHQHFIKKNGL
jgi:hypothetical protein